MPRPFRMPLSKVDTIMWCLGPSTCFSILTLRFLQPSPKYPDLEGSWYSSGSWVLRPVCAISWILILPGYEVGMGVTLQISIN